MPQFFDYSVPVDLTTALGFSLEYRAQGDTNRYAISGSLTTNAGEMFFAWTPACELTNSSYLYEVVMIGYTNTSIRQEGTITMAPNLGYSAPITNPTPIYTLDFATVQLRNIGLSPFSSTNVTQGLPGPPGPQGIPGTNGTLATNITITVTTNLNIMSMIITNITIGGGGGVGSYTNTSINGIPHTNNIMIGDSVSVSWSFGTDGVWRANSWSSNGLDWVVGGEHIGSVSNNGITLFKGSLQLYEEDLTCNVRIYDGSRLVPSVTLAGHPDTIGLYGRGIDGSYGLGWSHAGTDVGVLCANGIRLLNTNAAFYGRFVGDLTSVVSNYFGMFEGNFTGSFTGSLAGAYGYPEPLYIRFATNPTLPSLVITNSGTILVKDAGGTTKFSVDPQWTYFTGIKTQYTRNAANTAAITNIITYKSGLVTTFTP
jgi:hypothetical protein